MKNFVPYTYTDSKGRDWRIDYDLYWRDKFTGSLDEDGVDVYDTPKEVEEAIEEQFCDY